MLLKKYLSWVLERQLKHNPFCLFTEQKIFQKWDKVQIEKSCCDLKRSFNLQKQFLWSRAFMNGMVRGKGRVKGVYSSLVMEEIFEAKEICFKPHARMPFMTLLFLIQAKKDLDWMLLGGVCNQCI